MVTRALLFLFGLLSIMFAVFLGLMSLIGFAVSIDTSGRELAGVLGVMALLLFIGGIAALIIRKPARRDQSQADSMDKATVAKTAERPHTGRQYEDFNWGDPPPTRKQFGYAMHLRAVVRHGMTKWTLSDAIDEAIEQERSGEPATKEQLQTIKTRHGQLPRVITRGEAKRVIAFLDDYYLPCPFCGIEIAATDEMCCACNKSLNRLKIPIKL